MSPLGVTYKDAAYCKAVAEGDWRVVCVCLCTFHIDLIINFFLSLSLFLVFVAAKTLRLIFPASKTATLTIKGKVYSDFSADSWYTEKRYYTRDLEIVLQTWLWQVQSSCRGLSHDDSGWNNELYLRLCYLCTDPAAIGSADWFLQLRVHQAGFAIQACNSALEFAWYRFSLKFSYTEKKKNFSL